MRSHLLYRCAMGETWDSVGLKLFGDEAYAPEIMSANPDMTDKTRFLGGEVIYLPLVYLPIDEKRETPETAPWRTA